MKSELLPKLRKELKRKGDLKRAAGMQAYMKSSMPYHGVPAPELRKLAKKVFDAFPFESATTWQNEILGIWRGATFREERYCSIALSAHKKAVPFHVPSVLDMYEEMVVSGAWWDYVDAIASHQVGLLLKLHPTKMKPVMISWSKDENFWKRRTSIICQLTFKKETDLNLLYRCIEPSLDSKEFFLRKAIGWALRQYAWTDPKEVVRYVKANAKELSPLSKREALKNVIRSGRLKKIP